MQSTELLDLLLAKRGLHSEDERQKFLSPSYETDLHDPYLLKDMEKAVTRIFEATEALEKIVIYADYDCDGIPGAVILSDFFHKIGYENFTVYIPDRGDEGYGLHKAAIEEFIKTDVKLIITVDLGITAVLEVALAEASGVNVIITDHHLPQKELPRAFAIINPKRADCEYPYKMLSGAAVAWKLTQALVIKYGEYWQIKKGWEKWALDMAGLATLSDMVPLTGENRTLAHYGMMVLRKSSRPGLRELLRKLNIRQEHLTEDDLTFMVTPRVNAASRMGSPRSAYDLLSTSDPAEAILLATHLTTINDERKILVANIMRDVHKHLKMRELREVIVVGNPLWRVGVLGLVAGKISEVYARPAFVWGKENTDSVLKGSCRSDGSVNVVELMESVPDSFLAYGGHELAGGFSVRADQVHFLEDTLVGVFGKVKRDNKERNALHDAKLTLSDVHMANQKVIGSLAPFGLGNEKPTFLFEDVLLDSVKTFGKEKNHLELTVRDGTTRVKAISFFSAPTSFKKELRTGEKINLLATFDLSYFAGRSELRLRIVDII